MRKLVTLKCYICEKDYTVTEKRYRILRRMPLFHFNWCIECENNFEHDNLFRKPLKSAEHCSTRSHLDASKDLDHGTTDFD